MSVGLVVYLCDGCLAIPLNVIVRLIPTLPYIFILSFEGNRKA
ncbi:MAG TPA: hypothetical protein PKC55_06195 [Dysgonomonas sp.]|nr:hypothetical protein [Dysgonomonas sp.]HML64404.1 hypothetical protein [Dysgonomonas sp.]